MHYESLAALNLGVLLDSQGDVTRAEAAFQRSMDTDYPVYAPVAAFNLGLLLARKGDIVGAINAYRRAAGSGHADYGPIAANNLGVLLAGLEKIDGMLYRTVGVAFPLLSMLLITGAVWANESWGRYLGWDSKEVGALVAWMAYAGFLHTRIAHGWRGRRSATSRAGVAPA